jgi:hypothetical protein
MQAVAAELSGYAGKFRCLWLLMAQGTFICHDLLLPSIK